MNKATFSFLGFGDIEANENSLEKLLDKGLFSYDFVLFTGDVPNPEVFRKLGKKMVEQGLGDLGNKPNIARETEPKEALEQVEKEFRSIKEFFKEIQKNTRFIGIWGNADNTKMLRKVPIERYIEIIHNNFDDYMIKTARMRDMLIDGILSKVDHTLLNGPKGDKRAPDNVNISFLYCEGEAVTLELSMRGIYVASGSACTSRILEPSHVMRAIGRRYEAAHGSILMKVTPMHQEEEIKYVIDQIPTTIERIRSMSPIKGGS